MLDTRFRGADRDRTDDLRLAKPALSQLSYSPETSAHLKGAPFYLEFGLGRPNSDNIVGQGRLELPTSRLSGVRSNHLSYWPGRLWPAAEATCQTAKYLIVERPILVPENRVLFIANLRAAQSYKLLWSMFEYRGL